VVKIAGHLREGGATPALDIGICRAVTFYPLSAAGTRGTGISMPVTCEGADPYSFSGYVPPGDYQITASTPNLDDLSAGYQSYEFTVAAKQTLSADQPNLILDLPKRVSVKLTLTQGGLTPRVSSGVFYFTLTSARGEVFGVGDCSATACTAQVSPFADSYALAITHFNATGPVPATYTFAERAMTSSPLQLTYDIPLPTYRLKGKVLIDGRVPQFGDGICGALKFNPAGVDTTQSLSIDCYAEATFDGYLIGGTGPLVADFDLLADQLIDAQYVLSGDQLTAMFNVVTTHSGPSASGVVKRDGQALAPLSPGGAGARCGTVTLSSAAGATTADLDCAWGFSVPLVAGTYTPSVTVTDPAAVQALGAESARGAPITLHAGSGNVVDVKPIIKVAVGGYLVVNGQRPIESTSSDCGSVSFEPLDRQDHPTYLQYPCQGSTGFTFSGQVEKGAYRVWVDGPSYGTTNIPTGHYVWKDHLDITANNTGLKIDLPDGYAVYVAGVVQVNHQTPITSGEAGDCGSLLFEEQQKGYAASFALHCGAPNPYSFSGRLPAGAYRVTFNFPVANISEIGFDGSYVMTDRLEVK
jgi:hypothetical protein